MPSANVYSDIADSLCDALRGVEEARGIAETEFGEHDARTERLLAVWADVETVFRQFHGHRPIDHDPDEEAEIADREALQATGGIGRWPAMDAETNA